MRAMLALLLAVSLSGCVKHEAAPWPPAASMCWGNAIQDGEAIPDVRHVEYQLSSVTPEFLAEQAEAGRMDKFIAGSVACDPPTGSASETYGHTAADAVWRKVQ